MIRPAQLFLLTAAVLLAVSFGPTRADDLADRALTAMDAVDVEAWSFTETTDVNGTLVVKTHDATRAEDDRWEVVSVDGRAPTDEERSTYLQPETGGGVDDAGAPDPEANGAASKKEEDEGEIRAMIEPGTLELVDESATHATYRFRPGAEDEEDAEMVEHLEGTLRVNKDGPFVESIEMASRAPFSPQFGVKVKEFSTLLTFRRVGPERTVLPATVDVRFAGKAFLVKKIGETVRVRYSDYRRQGS